MNDENEARLTQETEKELRAAFYTPDLEELRALARHHARNQIRLLWIDFKFGDDSGWQPQPAGWDKGEEMHYYESASATSELEKILGSAEVQSIFDADLKLFGETVAACKPEELEAFKGQLQH